MSPTIHHQVFWLVVVSAALPAMAIAGDPYRPASDDQVLERLPATPLMDRSEMATLRQQLRSQPDNARLAGAAALAYLKMGNSVGDPRYFGYARAAIAKWWEDDRAPAELIRIRAKLKEKDHRYGDAIADLESLLTRVPGDTRAWIEVANLYRVTGDYSKSREACKSIEPHANAQEISICRIPLMISNGQCDEAKAQLETMLPASEKDSPALVKWIFLMQADAARVKGDTKIALRKFEDAFDRDPDDSYIKRAMAEFLIDQNQPTAALALVRDHTNDNGLLLLAAIAARRSGDMENSRKWQQELAIRFEEIRLRGSEPHGRFEARYLLELKDDADEALTVALANWDRQKEARDSRNVLDAAIAAGKSIAAKKVIEFLTASNCEDVELLQRIKTLESM